MVKRMLTFSHFVAFCFLVVMAIWFVLDNRNRMIAEIDTLAAQLEEQRLDIKDTK